MLFTKANAWLLKAQPPGAQNPPRLCYVQEIINTRKGQLIVTDGSHFIHSRFADGSYKRMFAVLDEGSLSLKGSVLMLKRYKLIVGLGGTLELEIEECIYLGEGSISGDPRDVNTTVAAGVRLVKAIPSVRVAKQNVVCSPLRKAVRGGGVVDDVVTADGRGIGLDGKEGPAIDRAGASQLKEISESLVRYYENCLSQSTLLADSDSSEPTLQRKYVVYSDEMPTKDGDKAEAKPLLRRKFVVFSQEDSQKSDPMAKLMEAHAATYIRNIRNGMVYRTPKIIIRAWRRRETLPSQQSGVRKDGKWFILRDHEEFYYISYIRKNMSRRCCHSTWPRPLSRQQPRQSMSSQQLASYLPCSLAQGLLNSVFTPSIDIEDVPAANLDSSVYTFSSSLLNSVTTDRALLSSSSDTAGDAVPQMCIDFLDFTCLERDQPHIDFNDFVSQGWEI